MCDHEPACFLNGIQRGWFYQQGSKPPTFCATPDTTPATGKVHAISNISTDATPTHGSPLLRFRGSDATSISMVTAHGVWTSAFNSFPPDLRHGRATTPTDRWTPWHKRAIFQRLATTRRMEARSVPEVRKILHNIYARVGISWRLERLDRRKRWGCFLMTCR
jgi:hypothetical protein